MEVRIMLLSSFICLSGFLFLVAQANITEIVNVCCELGTNWASSNDYCDAYYGEMSEVKAEDQPVCQQVFQVCCIKSKQEQMCSRGTTDGSVEGGRCAVRDDIIGAVTYKECCLCCQMGMAVKKAGMKCTSPFIGNPCDKMFMQCCDGDDSKSEDTDDGSPSFKIRPRDQVVGRGDGVSLQCVVEGDPPPTLFWRRESQEILIFPNQDNGHLSVTEDGTLHIKEVEDSDAGIYTCEARNTWGAIYASAKVEIIDRNTGIDECKIFGSDQLCSQICIDTPGSYRCECNHGYKLAADGRTCYRDDCPSGYAFNTVNGQCEDIDECVIGSHDCNKPNEICRNRRGSFYCQCDDGFHRNRTTMNCEDIDECARSMDTCTSSQRCENTVGSFACRRITPCGTGWTLDEETQECIDQDECAAKTANCGAGYECFNIEGSFRCNPIDCPDGSRFNPSTSKCERFNCPRGLRPDSSGLCVDINECEARESPCRSYQSCQNIYGSFRCIDAVQCGPGFEVDTDGLTCVDIDECAAGTHDCVGAAECINRRGSYICSCPQGYRRGINGVCEDKNECQFGNVCPSNAVCENTRGSYRCICVPGFEQSGSDRCRDINECRDPSVCSHGCTNMIGSYICTCDSGYELAPDGRTCVDIDECRLYGGPGVCAGNCVNTPGSYMCSCPNGWRLMGNDRSCGDIDECEEGTDRCGDGENVMCFNTRGSHRCPLVMCPSGFSRSALGPRRNSVRCKRLSFTCRKGDLECLNAPLSLSYNFLSFPTNVKIPTDLFSMSGPYALKKDFYWHLNITNTYSPRGYVKPVRRSDFDLRIGRNNNSAVVALLNRIEGPQDVELMLTMQITDTERRYTGNAISKIYLYVTSDKIQ